MYNEQQLVSFGNFLLEVYGVMVYSNEGKNLPLYQRQVSDADFSNWRTENGLNGIDDVQYPSRYAIGEKVKVFLMPEGEENFPGFNATITAVHFTNSKVKYDLEIRFYGDWTTRVYNVDSLLVTDI